MRPGVNSVLNLGDASHRWKQLFAATTTISTSDERLKQDIAELDAAEKRVAVALKGMIKKYRFNDAVQEKGPDARIHIGVIAQEVIDAFAAEGLDAHRYGLFCYDKWEDQYEEVSKNDGTTETVLITPAGEQYAIRYEELLAFIIAAL